LTNPRVLLVTTAAPRPHLAQDTLTGFARVMVAEAKEAWNVCYRSLTPWR